MFAFAFFVFFPVVFFSHNSPCKAPSKKAATHRKKGKKKKGRKGTEEKIRTWEATKWPAASGRGS
jgi:hypothetical protein